MKLGDLYNHFIVKADWVDPERTADLIEFGDPEKDIRRIGTGWTACVGNLNAAARDGCDLFITHEPSFCEFWDPQLRFRDSAWGQARIEVLKRNDMALMALHDTWDAWPEWGIEDSWHAYLGLSNPIATGTYRYQLDPTVPGGPLPLYEVPETTVDAFAHWIAGKVLPFGMHGVMVMGDGAAVVRKVALGTGCGTPSFEMIALGADLLVQPFDRAFQTITRIPCVELGANVIVLEHGVSEMPGMQNLVRYIQHTFPTLEATFYRHEPDSRFVYSDPTS